MSATSLPNESLVILYLSWLAILFVAVFAIFIVIKAQQRILKKQEQQFKQMLEALEAERMRIGKNLHDEISVLISAAQLKASAADMKELLEQIGHTARTAAHRLMPLQLKNTGLHQTLSNMVAQYTQTGSLALVLHNNRPDYNFSLGASIELYRIISELLNNAMRHAKASEINISLYFAGETLNIEVEDNGCGMDLNSQNFKKGLGWNNISSRTKLLNGRHSIESTAGKGCKVLLQFPLQQLAHHG